MEQNISKDKLIKLAKKKGIKNISKLSKMELTISILEKESFENLKELARNNGIKFRSKTELVENLSELFGKRYEPTEKVTKGGIPKIIHQIWIGGKIPPLQGLYSNTWKDMKDWKYKMWGNKDLTEKNFPITWKYIQKSLDAGRNKLGNVKKKYAQVGDLMRLEILYKYGGVYLSLIHI